MAQEMLSRSSRKYSEEEKKKAAYALNLCTVSVSQIIDYHDVYILEQEYDAILNNLNLKELPKDEALLKILRELLDTIAFFRINEVKKGQLDKKYQRRIKNAIWAAVPSLSVVVSGNPVAIAISLATQIGSGYMNYRKEKAKAGEDREDAEVELQISALEQFNGLRRELFTTAWRLAEEYEFADEWRLTEKQIKQYDAILMDRDENRKYARLEAISDKFDAYPPFWYFFGHTANYIAEMARKRIEENNQATAEDRARYRSDWSIAVSYTEKAKKHYEKYFAFCEFNILREDQLTASFALEYVDLLWSEEQKDTEKIIKLLHLAERMAPNTFDILQLCAISYLKIGESKEAARLLKLLVNEEYNPEANAKLLSRIYVNRYLQESKECVRQELYGEYKILEDRVDPLYLYPMPESNEKENELTEQFEMTQKAILKKIYRNSINSYEKEVARRFNAVLPMPEGVAVDQKIESREQEAYRLEGVRRELNSRNRENYIIQLSECNFRASYLDLLNQMIEELEELSVFRNTEAHDYLIYTVEAKLRNAKAELAEIQKKMDEGSFDYRDYKKLNDSFGVDDFTKDFFEKTKEKILDLIDTCSDEHEMDTYENELMDFCEHLKLPVPQTYLHLYDKGSRKQGFAAAPFEISLICDDNQTVKNVQELRNEMLNAVKDQLCLVADPKIQTVKISTLSDEDYKVYMHNRKLAGGEYSLYKTRQQAFAVIDDKTKKDCDLLFCVDGIGVVKKNTLRALIDYGSVEYIKDGEKESLNLGDYVTYKNKDIDLAKLSGVIEKLCKIET